MSQRFCCDCKHFRDGNCEHPSNIEINLVHGKPMPAQSANYLRERHSERYKACEPEALWFEPRLKVA